MDKNSWSCQCSHAVSKKIILGPTNVKKTSWFLNWNFTDPECVERIQGTFRPDVKLREKKVFSTRALLILIDHTMEEPCTTELFSIE